MIASWYWTLDSVRILSGTMGVFTAAHASLSVAEFDSPKNLLANDHGVFYSMCKMSGDFEELKAAADHHAKWD